MLVKTGQHAYRFEKVNPPLNYLLFLPQEYGNPPEQTWPLLLFLHGIGERGNLPEQVEYLKRYGPPQLVEHQLDFPFIVLSPQCPDEFYWVYLLDELMVLLDDVLATYRVDPTRIYVTGVSMGGFGTWRLALRHPTRFAAIAPIASGYKWHSKDIPHNIWALKDLPIWAFHGAQDDIIPSWQSEVLVAALRACGGNVRFTLYPDVHHDSWTVTYNNPELYQWFLQQTLRSAK